MDILIKRDQNIVNLSLSLRSFFAGWRKEMILNSKKCVFQFDSVQFIKKTF